MHTHDKDFHPARRNLLLLALAGFGAGATPFTRALAADLLAGRAIYQLKGDVRINGQRASETTLITGRDLIETGADGEIVFRVESDAFSLRAGSHLQFSPPPGDNLLVQGLRLLTGGLLAVFASRPHELQTANASLGIRGTGVYCGIEPDRDYLCTCYGKTELASIKDPLSKEQIDAGYHESRHVMHVADPGTCVRKIGVKDHSDEELTLLESMVGRVPAFRGRPGAASTGNPPG